MDLQQIKRTEALMMQVTARIAPLLSTEHAEALTAVDRAYSAVRQFADVWAHAAAVEREDREAARDLRDEAITMLVTTFRPQ